MLFCSKRRTFPDYVHYLQCPDTESGLLLEKSAANLGANWGPEKKEKKGVLKKYLNGQISKVSPPLL
jgi:hypothetical protein